MKQKNLINQKQRKKYESAKIQILSIELEDGIAAASARITSPANNAVPNITDWEETVDTKDWNF